MKLALVFVNILSVILECFILDLIFKTISNGGISSKLKLGIYAVVIISRAILISFVVNTYVMIGVSIVSILGLSLMYKTTWSKRFIGGVLLIFAFILSEMLVGFIMSLIHKISIKDTQDNIFYYITCSLDSKILVLLLAQIFKQVLTKDTTKLSKGVYASLILLPLSTLLIILVTTQLMYENNNIYFAILMIVAIICMLSVNIILIYLAERNIKQVMAEAENQIYAEKFSQQAKYYDGLIAKYRVDNKKLHDIDNRILVLRSMIGSHQSSAVDELKKVDDIIKESKGIGFTGIASLDAILNNTLDRIKGSSIAFNKHIFIQELDDIIEMDFCILLGNLLDNAVEECLRLEGVERENAFINCEVKQIDNYINILVENTKTTVETVDKTSKPDKFRHGYGTDIVQEIAYKYNGNVNIEKEIAKYSVMVLLELPDRAK